MVGWVKHAGTGPLDLSVVVSDMVDGKKIAFAGPVMSYYEYTSVNFKRLTDEEWQSQFFELSSLRPEFVADYLMDSESFYFDSLTITSIIDPQDPAIVRDIRLKPNYPNPFNAGTVIAFTIPSKLANKEAKSFSIMALSVF